MSDLSATDILNMDDDEFLKTNPDPSLAPKEEAASAPTPEAEEVVETPEAEETAEASSQEEETETPEVEETGEELTPEAQAKLDRERDEQGRFKAKEAKEAPEAKDDKTPVVETKVEAPTIDYKSSYEKLMAPFKANGRTVELKTPEEAVQLMQMGANYTKKMQELVPHRKMLTMLQNNGLLDEGKLSYLIDLSQKNPEAIKKLVKDAGINPMDIDVDAEPAYKEGNHRVSDEEVNFHTALEDMKSTPEKMETLRTINDGWDQVSKQALWSNPEILAVMHEQRANGVYARIADEVTRRQTLGAIPGNVPFLQAYKVVGDEMLAGGKLADLAKPAVQPPAQPVATRVAAPKPQVTNSAKAAAVSPNRTQPSNGKKPVVDYLNMSDEDFMKFDGRV